MLISGRKLKWAASKRSVVVGKEFMKCSGNNRPSNTKFGGNMMIGEAIGSKRKDIFLLSRGDRMHDELGIAHANDCMSGDFVAPTQGQ